MGGILIPMLLILLYNTPFAQRYTQRLIGEKLVKLVMGSSDQIKSITYEEMRYSLISSQLSFHNLNVVFHPNDNDSIFNSFSTKDINLDVDGLWKVYFKKSLVIEGLSINSPIVELHKRLNSNEKTSLSLQTGDLYYSISKILRTLAISTFELKTGHFTFFIHGEDGTSPIVINNLSLWIENFELDKESQSRKDKILFTDNIKVKLANQSVYLPDSIHSIHFDSLLLSTTDDSFLVHGFRIKANKNGEIKANYYDMHIPLLDISNVNYTKAYNQHELEIDKILFAGGDISIDNQKEKIEEKNPDLLLQLNQIFGKLKIKEFTIANANFSVNASPIGVPEKFDLHDLNLSIFEINLDQSNTSIDFSHHYFKDLELTLKNHTFEMVERNHRLQVEDLHVSTKTLLFAAGKIKIQPIVHSNEISTLNDAEIEGFKVEGFDPYQLVNDRQLLLKLLQVQKLNIKTTPKARTKQTGINPIASLEDLFPYVKPFTDRLKIDSLSIQNINLDIETRNGPFLVDHASLQIQLFNLDSTTHLLPENIFQVQNFIFFAPQTTLPIENQQIKIDSFYLNKDLQLLSTKAVSISKKEQIGTFGVIGSLDGLYFKGMKLRQLLYHQQYIFDSLIIKHPVLEILETGLTSQKQRKKSNISNFISAFAIGLISIEDGEIKYHEGNLEIASIDKLSLSIVNAELSQPHLLQNEVLVKYDDFLLGFNNLYYSTPEFKHVLRVESCQFHLKDSIGTIQNININPIISKDSLALFTVSIPAISFKGINDYNSYYNKKIDISSLQIQKPNITIEAGYGDSKKSKSGFPVLKSEMFLFDWDSLGVQDFKIMNGSLTFLNNAKQLKIKDFEVDIENFEVHAGKEMIPERFLFSKAVDFKFSKVHYSNTLTEDSLYVDKVILNSQNKALSLEDIRLSLTSANPISGSIPAINLKGFSFFDFTQNKKIIIDALTVNEPAIDLTIPKKNTDKKIERFAQLNTYPFDTAQLASIDIKNSKIVNAKILGIKDSTLSVGNIGFSLTNFVLHPDSITRNNLPFHSEIFELSVEDVQYKFNAMNKIQIGQFDYRSKPSTATITKLAIVPLYDKVAYGEKLGKQASWMSLKNSKTQINNLDFEKLIGTKAIHAKSVILDDMIIDVFRDKRLPFPEDQVRELPQRNLHELPFGVKIDSLVLKTGRVEYVEQSAKTDATGSIYFDKMHANITNITNDSVQMLKNPTMTATVETNLYGTGVTIVRFDFDLTAPDYAYKYSTSIGAFDLLKLNEILEPSILAKIKEGKLTSLQQVVNANDDYGQGEMVFRYDNLKIGLIKALDDPNPGLGKALASFFANTFIVRKRNQPPFVRKSDVFFERNHSKAIFDFLVKSTLSGVVESIGARSNRKKIKQHKKEAKQQAKKKNKVLPSDSN